MDFNRLYSFILDLISLYNIYGTAISYHAFGENKKHQNCNAETETKKKIHEKTNWLSGYVREWEKRNFHPMGLHNIDNLPR